MPPKKSILMLCAIAVTLTVAVAAISLTWPHNDNLPGPFVEYSMIGGNMEMNLRYEVTGATDTTRTVRLTVTAMGYTTDSTKDVPLSQPLGSNFDPNHPPDGYAVSARGTDPISTLWGEKVCDRYTATYLVSGEQTVVDLWVFQDFLIKMNSQTVHASMSMTMTDTNIPEITNG
jgi:hypothetical protein